jgi:hypothetical protein
MRESSNRRRLDPFTKLSASTGYWIAGSCLREPKLRFGGGRQARQ